ncbi:hypothetical protein GCK32_003708 [Trichostrongylus colubriformis]|uniref:Uncharacterized protein n=1 Tax=Trichostrongylus colubriformis TaxID=6319 RepID=A0AAN8FP76_TRICO
MEARKQRMKEIRRLLAENQATASSIVTETKKKLEGSLSHEEEGDKSVASAADTNSESKSSEVNGSCSEATTQISVEGAAINEELQLDENEENTRREIEDTFRNAELNLQNLTLLRKRLEEIQAHGGQGLSQEDQEFLKQLDETAAVAVPVGDNGSQSDDDEGGDGSHADNKEISFGQAESDIVQTESHSPSSDESTDRLKNIEQMLHKQTSMLTELLQRNQTTHALCNNSCAGQAERSAAAGCGEGGRGQQLLAGIDPARGGAPPASIAACPRPALPLSLVTASQPSNSRRASVVHSPCRLLELLHATSPALLRGLSACLLQLADGHPSPPHLERILNAICESGSQRLDSVTTGQGSVAPQV